MSVEDKCRIRDRSAILARHLWGEPEIADQHVHQLLASLQIRPEELPAEPPAAWQGVWDGLTPPEPVAAQQQAHAEAAAALHQPPASWDQLWAHRPGGDRVLDHVPPAAAAGVGAAADPLESAWQQAAGVDGVQVSGRSPCFGSQGSPPGYMTRRRRSRPAHGRSRRRRRGRPRPLRPSSERCRPPRTPSSATAGSCSS